MTEFSKSYEEEPSSKSEKEEPTGGQAPPSSKSEKPAAKTVIKLSPPPMELAARLLGKVNFKERLIGTRSHPGPGDTDKSLFSFEEAVNFLDAGELTGEDFVNSISFNSLKKWVDETLGDKELAQAIGELTKELFVNWKAPYQKYLKSIALITPVKELMQQRLKQSKEIMGIEIVEGETEA